MSCFKWGHAFFSLNEIYLERYAVCETSEELMQTQELLLQEVSQMREEVKNREIEMPDSGDSSDEDEELR